MLLISLFKSLHQTQNPNVLKELTMELTRNSRSVLLNRILSNSRLLGDKKPCNMGEVQRLEDIPKHLGARFGYHLVPKCDSFWEFIDPGL
jgi:hypothetical protein